MRQLFVFATALLLALGLALPRGAQAQMEEQGGPTTLKIGPRVGIPFGDVSSTGGNLFFGADARVDVEALPAHVVLSPSFDFYLTDDFAGSGLTVFAVDLNAFYEFEIEDQAFTPYAGGGIAITRISVDVGTGGFGTVNPSSTEIGLNLVGGARFPLGSVEPFAQFNVAAGAERLGITGGVLFGL